MMRFYNEQYSSMLGENARCGSIVFLMQCGVNKRDIEKSFQNYYISNEFLLDTHHVYYRVAIFYYA